MVSIFSLLLPIILSSVVVFIVSFLLHMVLTYHNSDFKKLPAEDKVMDDLRANNIPEGDYLVPYAITNQERREKAFTDKLTRGPVAMLSIFRPGPPNMTSSLVQWFIYTIIVGIFAAYISGRALPPGAYYLQVFRFVGASSFLGYSMALMQNSIWFRKSWSATLKSMFDGLIYALLTAGIFGWLWPAA